MRYIITMLVLLCATATTFAQETTHTLEAGDTFASLSETYDTCRDAIIYENNLTLNGYYSKYFFLPAGTDLIIPSKSRCNSLPPYRDYVVAEGDTTESLLETYQSPMMTIWKRIPTEGDNYRNVIVTDETELNVGDKLMIQYEFMQPLVTASELFVVDESTEFESVEHTLQVDDTLDQLAEQYRTCREAIIWENQLLIESGSSVGYVLEEGDTLTMPPATACDTLPTGQYELTLDEPTTQRQIITRYEQYPQHYFEFNTSHAGLLPADTVQILPDIDNVFWQQYDIIVQPEDAENRTHKLERYDTFDRLTQQYNTCAEAILYHNRDVLRRTNALNPTFIVEVGTDIEIPPASECDIIPTDPITYNVKEGDTLWSIGYRYNLHFDEILQASADSTDSSLTREALQTFNSNKIGTDLTLVIPDQSGEFDLRYNDRLLIYEEDDRIEYIPSSLSLSEVAQCYGLDESVMRDINGLSQTQFTGGSLILPNPQHECILYGTNRYGALACYPEPLEDVVDISGDAPPVKLYRPDTAYCYTPHDVYEALFYDQSVILFDSRLNGYLNNSEQWDLSMNMINYCFRDDKDALRDITWDDYDATILPPDDNITVFALPEHITCNREMFNDYYMYSVQSFDTLSNIARAYGTHPDLIASANNMDNKHLIFVGQYLEIPRPTLPHIMQGLATGVALLLVVVGLRRVMRRRTAKVKRKPKEV